MYLLLDTSQSVCRIWLVNGDTEAYYEWEAGRDLARGLLSFLIEKLALHQQDIQDLKGIGVQRGPGSFTGLRIGISTVNTLAYFAHIPVAGATGDAWREYAIRQLKDGVDEKIILPEYGRAARITQPKK